VVLRAVLLVGGTDGMADGVRVVGGATGALSPIGRRCCTDTEGPPTGRVLVTAVVSTTVPTARTVMVVGGMQHAMHAEALLVLLASRALCVNGACR